MSQYHVISQNVRLPSVSPVILIPAYQPDQTLVELVRCIQQEQQQRQLFCPIVIINDGSAPELTPLFAQLDSFSQVTVLHHDQNRGKGAALKTGMSWFLKQYPRDCPGVVIADADGQHLAKDILRIAGRLSQAPEKLWLGCRHFDEHDIPWRSRFGNNLTKKIYGWFTGQQLSDTQTGLRAIPRSYLPVLLKIGADGYEFELEMLLQARRHQVMLEELTITTVYEPGNRSSHFNPLLDSLKIYARFIRFAGVGLASAGLDYLLFVMAYYLSGEILLSIVLSRAASGLFNFTCNRQFVFNGQGSLVHEATKYSLLAMALIMLSFALTKTFYIVGITPFIGKLLAEGLVFTLSFFIQRQLVFKEQPSTEG